VAAPDEQIREAWKRYRLSEFSDALRIFQSVAASQLPGSEATFRNLWRGLVLESPARRTG
jgi:hypothetical protein